ncbi:mechanosensitive ion channel family protein [Paracoccus laeviglucosivorans]|uniref:mechanosensitive ion channel family protein n=1 Tax=Paracoccus laeviglucosivorans TaxID=1197861 RepID=UPI001158C2CE|nr:mechanosensitive ion channel family protein [Paracoccus laeviglucosivorans]
MAILFLATLPVHAQDAAPAEAVAAAPAPEAEAGELDGLENPNIDAATLTLRLIPLTAEELEKLSADWLAIVRASTVDVVDEQIRINNTSAELVEEAARARLTEVTESRRALFDKYSTILDAWELKGGDAAKIAGYRTYRSAIIVEETRNTDWRTLLAQATSWVVSADGGLRVATNVGIVLASFLGLLLLARLVRRTVRHWAGRIPNFSKLLVGFSALAAYWLTLAIGLMVVLAALGVNITPLFALIGGASFILAFAMQQTLGNLASGLMIMVNRPFDEGDSVDIGGVSGTVRDVSIVSTTVITPDNQIVVVPNSSVWGNVITNSTASETRRVDLMFGVSYKTPIARAQAELEKVVRSHALVLSEPEPVVRVNALTDSGVEFILRPWTKSENYWAVYWDLTREVKDALDRAGMEEVEAGAPPVVAPPTGVAAAS